MEQEKEKRKRRSLASKIRKEIEELLSLQLSVTMKIAIENIIKENLRDYRSRITLKDLEELIEIKKEQYKVIKEFDVVIVI